MEKGVSVLAEALLPAMSAKVDVIGTGPEQAHLARVPGAMLHGYRDAYGVQQAMLSARALVVPSICYESFPRILVEAFSCRLPVIASRLGSLVELVQEGVTGLLFDPGSARDLRTKVEWALAHPEEMRRMGEAAYAEYERKYTPEVNYQKLMSVYGEAIAETSRDR